MCLLCAIIGVVVTKSDINIFTQIGFLVLVGLACKNAILIVEFAKAQREEGRSRLEATLDACQLRLRPIIMTSFAFILGVVPLMLSEGAGAEMRRTLGTAVFSGMLGVTLFGIFLTPVFYYVIQWCSRDMRQLQTDRQREQPAVESSMHGHGHGHWQAAHLLKCDEQVRLVEKLWKSGVSCVPKREILTAVGDKGGIPFAVRTLFSQRSALPFPFLIVPPLGDIRNARLVSWFFAASRAKLRRGKKWGQGGRRYRYIRSSASVSFGVPTEYRKTSTSCSMQRRTASLTTSGPDIMTVEPASV